MRANTDELSDQILDIIERHIRLDPDDEGDPGEAAQRIIDDIIVPIANGEDMTTIDHAAEIERLRGDAEWEHAVRNLSTGEVFEPVNGKWWRTTDNEESVRRRVAGPWEPVEGDGDA